MTLVSYKPPSDLKFAKSLLGTLSCMACVCVCVCLSVTALADTYPGFYGSLDSMERGTVE